MPLSLNNAQEKRSPKGKTPSWRKWKEMKETLEKSEIYFRGAVSLCWRKVPPKTRKGSIFKSLELQQWKKQAPKATPKLRHCFQPWEQQREKQGEGNFGYLLRAAKWENLLMSPALILC